MTLYENVTIILLDYFLNHWSFFVIGAFTLLFALKWFDYYFRVDHKTDHIDLLQRYIDLKMRVRYGKPRI
jgi:hypothetical protein